MSDLNKETTDKINLTLNPDLQTELNETLKDSFATAQDEAPQDINPPKQEPAQQEEDAPPAQSKQNDDERLDDNLKEEPQNITGHYYSEKTQQDEQKEHSYYQQNETVGNAAQKFNSVPPKAPPPPNAPPPNAPPPNAPPNNYSSTSNSKHDAPPNYVPAKQKQPKRRVGMFTLALALIFCGVMLVLQLLMPALNLATVLKLTPIFLIILGLEVLFISIFAKDKTQKIGFGGLFVCMILILISSSVSMVPNTVSMVLNRDKESSRLSAELTESLQTNLNNAKFPHSGGAVTAEADVYMNELNFEAGSSAKALSAYDNIRIRLNFNTQFASAEEFANSCAAANSAIRSELSYISYIAYYSSNYDDFSYTNDVIYLLNLSNAAQLDIPADRLSSLVTTKKWSPEHSQYFTDEEIRARASGNAEVAPVVEDIVSEASSMIELQPIDEQANENLSENIAAETEISSEAQEAQAEPAAA